MTYNPFKVSVNTFPANQTRDHGSALPVCSSLLFSVSVDPNDQKKTACFDIDVEVDDPLKAQMTSFLSSTTNQQEIAALEMKVGVQ